MARIVFAGSMRTPRCAGGQGEGQVGTLLRDQVVGDLATRFEWDAQLDELLEDQATTPTTTPSRRP